MNWDIIVSQKAKKELKQLPDKTRKRVIEILIQMRENPYPSRTRKLSQGNGFRIRVGNYRIIYNVLIELKEIKIYHIRHRKDAYRS